MTKQRVSDQQAGFAGGLNITSDPAFLRPDQSRQMANFRLSAYGAALKRLGTALTQAAALTTFNSTGGVYGGIYGLGSAYVFAAATNSTAIHVYNASSTIIGGPVSWTDMVAIPQWRPVLFNDGTNDVFYVAGSTGVKVQKYGGASTVTALGAGTSASTALCIYNDRLWGFDGTNLYYSNLSSATASTGGDSLGDTGAGGGTIKVRTFSANAIRAIAAVNGSLLIFHGRGISVLTGWGQDDVEVQPQALNAQIGMGEAQPEGLVVANIASEGDVAYFITDAGVYATNGGYVRPLGTPDKPDPVAAILRGSTLEARRIQLAFNRQFNEIWVYTTMGIYVYNVILAAWSGPYTGTYTYPVSTWPSPQAFFEVTDSQGTSHLWHVAYSTSPVLGTFVEQCDTPAAFRDRVVDPQGANTGGTAVTATLQLHRMFCGDRVYAKTFRWLNLLATLRSGATAPTVDYTANVNGSGTLTLSNLTSVEQQYYLSPGGTGVYLDATINDANTTTTSQYALATVEGFFLGQR